MTLGYGKTYILDLEKQLYVYKDKENKIIEYIKFNFCNDNDLNECWHNDFNNILKIINGEYKESE